MKKRTVSHKPTTSRTRRSRHPERASLSADDAVGRDWISELRCSVNSALPEHRYGPTLPRELHQQLEMVGILTKKSAQEVFAFCLCYGLRYLLKKFRGISTIRACRRAVLLAGSKDIGWFYWGFEPAARNGRSRRSFRKIDPDDVALCADVARDLGVSATTLATLAVMAVLLEIRAVPDAIKEDILAELSRFCRELEDRATTAQELRDRACTLKPPSLTFTLDDAVKPSRKK